MPPCGSPLVCTVKSPTLFVCVHACVCACVNETLYEFNPSYHYCIEYKREILFQLILIGTEKSFTYDIVFGNISEQDEKKEAGNSEREYCSFLLGTVWMVCILAHFLQPFTVYKYWLVKY